MQTNNEPRPPFPSQKLSQPGLESDLEQRPRFEAPLYRPAGKLAGRRALITGGDSGIGRAVALIYAREGADVAITHLPAEIGDARETQSAVEAEGRKCFLLEGDLCDPRFCEIAVDRAVETLGGIDILVSNAAYQARKAQIEDITIEEWERTFKTNIEAYFLLAKRAVPLMPRGSCIIATGSVTGFEGAKTLLDYSSTKGAIESFSKSLAQSLVSRGIRVNVVAPGPVWTPLNPADPGLSPDKVKEFGSKTPMGRAAQPEELAPAYVLLASNADSSYVTGAVIAEFGGQVVQ